MTGKREAKFGHLASPWISSEEGSGNWKKVPVISHKEINEKVTTKNNFAAIGKRSETSKWVAHIQVKRGDRKQTWNYMENYDMQ